MEVGKTAVLVIHDPEAWDSRKTPEKCNMSIPDEATPCGVFRHVAHVSN